MVLGATLLDGNNWASVSEIRVRELREPARIVEDGDTMLVELVARGVALTVRVPSGSLVAPYDPIIDRPVLTPGPEAGERWYYRIPEGASVFRDDGRRAGRVRQRPQRLRTAAPYFLV